jgi:hypothetical protein
VFFLDWDELDRELDRRGDMRAIFATSYPPAAIHFSTAARLKNPSIGISVDQNSLFFSSQEFVA